MTLSRMPVSNACPGFQFGLADFTAAYIAALYCPSYLSLIHIYESAAKSIDETLEKMGLDYLVIMIIHSPQPLFTTKKGHFTKMCIRDRFYGG